MSCIDLEAYFIITLCPSVRDCQSCHQICRLLTAGDSSGGNLAAAVTLRARDENWNPALKAQVLFYPPLQAINFNTPSYQRYR